MEFFSLNNPDLYFTIGISVVNAFFLCLMAYKFMQVIQLSGYRLDEYGRWLKDTKAKWVSRLAMLAFLALASMIVTNVLFQAFQENKILGYFGLIFYFGLCIIFIVRMHSIPQKTPLVLTKRVMRLYLILGIISAILTFGTLYVSLSFTFVFRISVLALLPLSIPLTVPLANIFVWPLEMLIQKIYIFKAKRKLNGMPNLIKIGITGSYGKTSTKFYLNEILKSKYKVCCSPKSYNTPMGLTKVVLNDLNKDHEILIAEMGATHVKDIDKLCKIIQPNNAILTSVAEQHLQTFGSLENVKRTKYELIENLQEDSIAVFNGNNQIVNDLFKSCDLKNKYLIGIELQDAFVSARNVIATENGLQFEICINGEYMQAKTTVLGEHNLQNILMAVAMSLKLGVLPEDIILAIEQLKSPEHRLELKRTDNDILILDDSFNANIQGTAVALKTLNLFTNKRKIVVTPGLIELGKNEKLENIEFGKRIAEIADIAILVNKTQSKNIKEGLLQAKFDEKNIYEVDTLFDVTELFKTLLQPNDIVLLENDLPDNYR